MKYFLDCEFIEDGNTIDLISIGIISEDNKEYYAINYNCDFTKASPWVKANVLNTLPKKPIPVFYASSEDFKNSKEYKQGWRTKSLIAKEVIEFIGEDSNVEFWGEWPSYDWVVFCQLFGTMMDLPYNFPMRCRDVVQYLEDHLGLSQSAWPESLETLGNHNALLGAKTVKLRYEWCKYRDSIVL